MKERKKGKIERQTDRQKERKKERTKERKKERQKEKNQNRKREDFNHLSVHQWLRSAIPDSQQPTSPIGFLFLKLPPPPCAVLLVFFVYLLSMFFVHLTTGVNLGQYSMEHMAIRLSYLNVGS
jgi:hypothetical protein